ncbi:hemerythrin domain-containing protein [Streptomyces antimicrobicus]|uniref:Hemerythrin domain-containing protein n=1 Tax=Streptomyces antimicrobicus TaxID=2883108 RepID=A0ABS8B5B2_9ACTN|nr:hemerythrin domain-containing protein [Streptomyces antimicrobicus]MCB5179783.1 hemerythrin domain-containing protein [Streptomyces antimicrobicus]
MSTDAIVMLREDHRRIRKLIRAYRAAGGGPGTGRAGEGTAADTGGRGEVMDELLHELTVHTYVEEEVVYPLVRRLVPETDSLVLEFHEEHHVADVLAAELAGMKPEDESFDAKARVMADAVERHMQSEEQQWFPRVRESLGRKELQAIGSRMAEVREKAPARPRQPLLRRVADALAA